jgi:branched-chain amino acid transport system permease protein
VTEFIILGIFSGASYALASMGIVLTYKTSGIFNFAYGGIALFLAYVFWTLRDKWHLNEWISLPLVLIVVAPLLGLLLEAIFRPLAAVAVEVQIVVALGILAFFITLVPIIFGATPTNLPTIFSHRHFRFDGITILFGGVAGESGLFTLLTAAGLAVFLFVLLQRTQFGTATRAVVDNRELAGLIAVNSNRVGQATWIISTVFAAISGILLSTQSGLDIREIPLLALYSLAPAVLGRLVSLPLAFGGSIALGVAQDVLQKFNTTGTVANIESSIPYFTLILLLMVYGSRLKEVRSSLRSLPDPGRYFEREKVRLPWGVGSAVAAGVLIPLMFSGPIQHDIAEAMAYSIVALTVVVLTGWTGQISIAQMSFAAIGAFSVAHMAGTVGSRFPLGILFGVLIAAPVGVIIGLPSLRLSGLFLALATLAFALIMDTFVYSFGAITGGQTGIGVSTVSLGPISLRGYTSQFYLCLAVLTVLAAGAWLLKRGPIGRRLSMVRDSPAAASTLGANLTLTKLAVFAVCGVVASIGGSLLAMTQQSVDPMNFAWNTSLQVLLLVVVGGRSFISGAVAAGALQLVQLLPGIPPVVHTYEPLTIAVTVILIAKGYQGLPQNAFDQARYCMAVLYRLPRPPRAARTAADRPAPDGPPVPVPAPEPVTAEVPALSTRVTHG